MWIVWVPVWDYKRDGLDHTFLIPAYKTEQQANEKIKERLFNMFTTASVIGRDYLNRMKLTDGFEPELARKLAGEFDIPFDASIMHLITELFLDKKSEDYIRKLVDKFDAYELYWAEEVNGVAIGVAIGDDMIPAI